MPAIVRCPNGCKLQVPVRKLFDSFQCPKCSNSLFVAQNQIDEFEKNRKHVLEANLSSDLTEISSADIIYLEGAPADLLVEVVEENQKTAPEPPPVVDHSVSDAYFANETDPFAKPVPPPIQTGPSESNIEKPGLSELTDSTDLVEEVPPPISVPAAETASAAPSDHAMANDSAKLEPENKAVSKSSQSNSRSKKTKESNSGSGMGKHDSRPDPVTQSVAAVDPPKDFLIRWFSNSENPGVEHRSENRWKAYSLAWAMVVIGVLLLGPVMYTMMQWVGKDYHMPLGRWSFMLIFFSAIQFLYAFFLFQLPDWSSTRFVSYLMLLMTVMSSFMLAVAYLSQESNNFFNFLQLSVTNKQLVCSWLTVMSIGFGLMSYLCGRTTQNWMEEEKRLRTG